MPALPVARSQHPGCYFTMKAPLPKQIKRSQLLRAILLLFLIVLVGIGAAPWYLKGSWPPKAPPIETLRSLRSTLKNGISLPNLPNQKQENIFIGGQRWSFQIINIQNLANTQEPRDENSNTSTPETKIVLLLRPQKDAKDQPEVEWTDIDGQQQWETDSHRLRKLSIEGRTRHQSAKVKVRFFRGWTLENRPFQSWLSNQTFAVMQWYAWPAGGNPAPFQWFLADQIAQWHGHRLPWVAVSILIPTEPMVEDLDRYWPIAESLGKIVQKTLMAGPLKQQE